MAAGAAAVVDALASVDVLLAASTALSPREREVAEFSAVLTSAECRRVVDAAEASVGWGSARHAAHSSVDIPVASLPALRGWLPAAVAARLLRPMEACFGLPDGELARGPPRGAGPGVLPQGLGHRPAMANLRPASPPPPSRGGGP